MPITYQHEVDPRLQAFLTYMGSFAEQDARNRAASAQMNTQANMAGGQALGAGVAGAGQGVARGIIGATELSARRSENATERLFRQGLQDSSQFFQGAQNALSRQATENLNAQQWEQQQDLQRFQQTGQFTDDLQADILNEATNPRTSLGASALGGPLGDVTNAFNPLPDTSGPTEQEQAILAMPGQPFKRDFTASQRTSIAQLQNSLATIQADPSIPEYARAQAQQVVARRMANIRPQIMLNNEKPPPTVPQLLQSGMAQRYGDTMILPRFDKGGGVSGYTGVNVTGDQEGFVQLRTKEYEAQGVDPFDSYRQANQDWIDSRTYQKEEGVYTVQPNGEIKFDERNQQKSTAETFDAGKIIEKLATTQVEGSLPGEKRSLTPEEIREKTNLIRGEVEAQQRQTEVVKRAQQAIDEMRQSNGLFTPESAAQDLAKIDQIAAQLLSTYPSGALPPNAQDIVSQLGYLRNKYRTQLGQTPTGIIK